MTALGLTPVLVLHAAAPSHVKGRWGILRLYLLEAQIGN